MESFLGYFTLVVINYFIVVALNTFLSNNGKKPHPLLLLASLLIFFPVLLLLFDVMEILLDKYGEDFFERLRTVFDWALPKK